MPIDPSIALSGKGLQLNDPFEVQARRQQVQANALSMQNAESQNALAQQTALDKQVMRKLYAESYDSNTGSVDYTKLAQRAAQLGIGSEIPAIQTAGQEFKAKQQATTKDFNANVSSSMDNARMRLEGVRTPEQFMQWHEQNHNDPTLKEYFDRIGVTPEQSRAQIAAVANDPAAFGDLLQKAQLGLVRAQTAVNEQANRNVAIRGQNMTAETAKAGQQVTMRGQDIGERVAREVAAGRLTSQTNAAGDVNFFNNKGELVSTLKGAGKPSATFAKTKILRENAVRDMTTAIGQLETALVPNGLIDRATSSGAGALVNRGAAFVGRSTQGGEAIGALQPIYDLVLKMVPRFEGPQSDKDTASYNKAAGDLANPNIPKAIKKASAKTILNLMKLRRNQFISQEEAAGGGVVGEAPSGGYDFRAADAIVGLEGQ